MTVPQPQKCGITTCVVCYPVTAAFYAGIPANNIVFNSNNDIKPFGATKKESTMAVATPTVEATVTTKTTKTFNLALDEETASRLFDVLYRHVGGGGSLAKVTTALERAGVDKAPRFKNTNELKNGSYAYGYKWGYTMLKELAPGEDSEIF